MLLSTSNFPNSLLPFPLPKFTPPFSPTIKCAKRTKRTGKLRYPSEKKKLKQQKQPQIDVKNKFEGIWRLSKLAVSVDKDPGKDFIAVSEPLLQEVSKVLEFPVASMLPPEAFTVIRKSFDARKSQKEPKFVYTVDMDVQKLLDLEPRTWEFISELETRVGVIEHLPNNICSNDLINLVNNFKIRETIVGTEGLQINFGSSTSQPSTRRPSVAVVGSGPAGLFASLVLAEFGADVTLLERGQAVEQRGRDIGALVVRRLLQMESNFCFGEGGAGTWSDGKLVTRIGRNSASVISILETLVHFGAPKSILIDGKPHLGTDRLIPLLRNFRHYLEELGVTVRFGTRVDDLLVEDSTVVGVKVSDSKDAGCSNNQKWRYDAIVLAVGHSARDTYNMLLSHGVDLVQKDFAVGLRIEHPQELINSIQYSALASEVMNGRGKVPVADYKVAEYINLKEDQEVSSLVSENRSCYSFCMCPGGQVVLTSTNPSELCINGMSFSRRSSRWANSALVATVSFKDFDALGFNGPLAGVEFQRLFERKAAEMGGGNFVVPVQRVTDFLENKMSGASLPASSYRLGVQAANLHELFPTNVTQALQQSISSFDKELPGFISDAALLHGVETRTSSPVQISRRPDTYESTSVKGLYPVGEGAGYAGGIVSAAVDGMHAGFALARSLGLYKGNLELDLGKAQNAGIVRY
ncbi:hypothetical protein Leryth_020916 [Lithospermum erythrorhizon]|uniref:Oxidoreductase n=1 Tax=Lithospermum erythrorhizon TaxID=34254 RepID=A0AAV3QHX8_LITER|nr:hypothetical protein Leryth_020916 [Lithospermum erythrorhizon]